MKSEITEVKCDVCGKVVKAPQGPLFGPDPMCDWYLLSRITSPGNGRTLRRDRDICSGKCLVAIATAVQGCCDGLPVVID